MLFFKAYFSYKITLRVLDIAERLIADKDYANKVYRNSKSLGNCVYQAVEKVKMRTTNLLVA